MKRRLLFSLAALVLLAILPVSLLGAGWMLPSCYQDSYYAELPEQYHRLTSSPGKRIILVGGSNIAFGVDVQLLEDLLAQHGYEYMVCPFGLYAAVGTSAMLELSQPQLREGDIAVLAIEPTDDTLSSYFGASAFWKCSEDAPELLAGVSSAHQAALAGNYISYLQSRAEILRSGTFPALEGVYAKASFDENANMTYPREGNLMTLGWDTSEPVNLAAVSIAPDFAQQVNRYVQAARDKGAAVYLSFSPVNRSALQGDPAAGAEAFYQTCLDAFPQCPILSDPNRYILDSGWFYDSNFHLNTSGAVLRTCLLAEDLLAELGCSDPLGYPLPSMPAPIPAPAEDGPAAALPDHADSGCFLFSPLNEEGSGYLVSGLTDAGASQTSLTIPAQYSGLPVLGIDRHALEGADLLQELWVPDSILSLPDYAFAGCPNLTRLVLTHTQQPCRITEHTFDGAPLSMKVYVPAAAYPLYRDGYGCEKNQWEGLLNRILQY